MAKLSYASVIEHDRRYKMLADLGLRMNEADAVRLLPRLVDLVAPEHFGEIRRDGTYAHGQSDHWAHYRITLNGALTNDQAALLRHTLQAFAPARCVLAALDYRHAAVRHNGRASRDGTFNRGTA